MMPTFFFGHRVLRSKPLLGIYNKSFRIFITLLLFFLFSFFLFLMKAEGVIRTKEGDGGDWERRERREKIVVEKITMVVIRDYPGLPRVTHCPNNNQRVVNLKSFICIALVILFGISF